jgi:hypothetical protein
MKGKRRREVVAESEAVAEDATLDLEAGERPSFEELLATLPDKLREALAIGLGGLALFALVATVTYHYGSYHMGGSYEMGGTARYYLCPHQHLSSPLSHPGGNP